MIVPLGRDTLGLLHRADARFLAGDRVQLRMTRHGFALDYAPMAVAEWRTVRPYPVLATELLERPDWVCYLAFAEDQPAGQCILKTGEHSLCELLDIRTDSRYRRQGIATELVETALEWAVRNGCAGLRAAATDEWPVACQFFEKTGFALGGIDRFWHAADPDQAKKLPGLRETVLLYYRFSE